jgi:hypothetical protein
MLAASQTDFARSLLDPERALPAGLMAHTSQRPEKRFAVYRNNVVVSLIAALRTKFPATERIVGEEFFGAMARVFVMAHPPRSKILHTYGEDFGDFIARFEPAAELVYLADVARLEAARTRAYHAADATALNAADFGGIAPDAIGSLRVTLHPSLDILRSRHPVVTIWSMNAGEAELAPVDESRAEDALIVRPDLDVTVRLLPPGGADFIAGLREGATLAQAAESTTAAEPRFDLTQNLAGLIGSGAIAGLAFADLAFADLAFAEGLPS